MQDLLTRGIDEQGNLRSEETHEFKDSPLGRIPVEWDYCILGKHIELLTDYHANGSYERLKENVELLSEPDYAVMIRTTNFEKNDFDDLIFITKEAYIFLKKSSVKPGDLLMNKIANAGAVYLMPDLKRPVSTGMNLFLIRTNERIVLQEFAFYFLDFHEAYVKSFSKGTTTKTITKNAVRDIYIHKPTFKEQEKIVTLLKNQCDFIATLAKNLKKLQLLKTALMQDLLTGKVRVTPLMETTEGLTP
jgi:type I restriction enzyme S subunit